MFLFNRFQKQNGKLLWNYLVRSKLFSKLYYSFFLSPAYFDKPKGVLLTHRAGYKISATN